MNVCAILEEAIDRLTTVNERERVLLGALKAIARGHPVSGTPLARRDSQGIARMALVRLGESWPPKDRRP